MPRVRGKARVEGRPFANVLAIVGAVLTTGQLAMDEAMRRTFARIFFGAMSSAEASGPWVEPPTSAR